MKSGENGKRPSVCEFGSFRFDLAQRILSRNGDEIPLNPKTLELLDFFLHRSNEVVGKDELMRGLWPESFVEEANLTVHISKLRKIFASVDDGSISIETFPKIGYRFNGNVQRISNTFDRFDEDERDFSVREPGFEKGRWPRSWKIVLGTGAVAASVLLLFGFFGRRSERVPRIERVRGTEQSSALAISPNGEYIAHAVSKAGKRTLMMTHIGSGSGVVLHPADEGLYYGLTFSKDGNQLYFVKAIEERRSLFRIPVLGGNVVKIFDDVGAKVSFSPTGNQFCFVRRVNDSTSIMIANVDGTGEASLSSRKMPQYYSDFEIAWSPDGKTIATLAGDRDKGGSQLIGINTITGEETAIAETRWAGGDGLEWLDDGNAIVAGLFEKGNSPTQVWLIPFPTGEARRITNDTENYGSVGISVAGNVILAGQFKDTSSLWIQPSDVTAAARPVSNEKHHLYKWVRWTGDGKLIYASSIGENRDIYTMETSGNNERQITENARNNIMPVTTPDGKILVFASNRAGKGVFNLYRSNSDGEGVAQITFGDGEFQPAVSADGRWVFYTAGNPDGDPLQRSIWKVPIDGGEPVSVVSKPSFSADASPDGENIACLIKDSVEAAWHIGVVDTRNGSIVKSVDAPFSNVVQWMPDGKGVSFIKTADGVANIWSQDLSGGPPRQMTKFSSDAIANFDWSQSGDLVCSRTSKTRDAFLIRDFE
jgi:Tol biopolymer transport system component/DNA-binding winged helix-turn-helix (wHTH) protein